MARPNLIHNITDDSALGGSVIERSLRFNDDDSAVLTRTPSGVGNRKTYTISAWVKRCSFGGVHPIFARYTANNDAGFLGLYINNDDYIYFTGWSTVYVKSNRLYRDSNGWSHILLKVDTTQGTASDRIKLYFNGELQTLATYNAPSQNADLNINEAVEHRIGNYNPSGGNFFDGYMADIHFLDGYAYDSSYFGYTDSQTGLWRPKKYEGVYGTNGFHLEFKDNSSTSALGKDTSGNSNNWTANNFSLTNGKNYDSMIDTPTNNFPTLNPLNSDPYSSNSYTPPTLRDGNLNYRTNTTSLNNYSESSIYFPKSGKWYIEIILSNVNIGSGVGYAQIDVAGYYLWWHYASPYYEIQTVSGKRTIGSLSNDDIIQIAYDVDSGYIWYGKNNSWYLSGNPSSGTPMSPAAQSSNSDGSVKLFLNGRSGSAQNIMHVNFGQRPFNYTPPTGFKALSSKNLPPNVPSIIRPQKHFDTITYTGTDTSAARTVTSLEFAPDLVWQKRRNGTNWHGLFDTSRGVGKELFPNDTAAETTNNQYGYISAFGTNGFTWSPGSTNNSDGNETNGTFASWCWKAGGAAVTNNDGGIASSVSVNTEAGFSIGTFSGSGSSNTVGTGLDNTKVVILKNRSTGSTNWVFYHKIIDGSYDFLYLNLTNANANSALSHTMTNTFKVGSNNDTNASGSNYVFYAWSEIPGFSKFGKYSGNGSSTNGQYVHLGFRPAWVMLKRSDSADHWIIKDSKRNTTNDVFSNLGANISNAEFGSSGNVQSADFLSNGVKLRGSDSGINSSSGTYIYFAFAESSLKYSRAR